jgi:hypothetical protein
MCLSLSLRITRVHTGYRGVWWRRRRGREARHGRKRRRIRIWRLSERCACSEISTQHHRGHKRQRASDAEEGIDETEGREREDVYESLVQ